MTQTFYKLDIQGIVYLVDPVTAIAYTYDLTSPTAIGKLVWTDINAAPQIELYPDWEEILREKLAVGAPVLTTTNDDGTELSTGS